MFFFREKKVVVTHGTDTMIETARYIQNSMKTDKVVVFTGAFLPETFKDSDATFNVGVAVGAVQVLLFSHVTPFAL